LLDCDSNDVIISDSQLAIRDVASNRERYLLSVCELADRARDRHGDLYRPLRGDV
jgi:hypothetical protein